MTDWSNLFSESEKQKRTEFAEELLGMMSGECLTRKPRDHVKHELMLQLGFQEKFTEVQIPSPGNTPDDLDDDDL